MRIHPIIFAVHLILEKDEKVLLYHRGDHARYKPNEFGLISGHVEFHESCMQAIIREASEEIDIQISEADLELVHTLHKLENQEVSIELFYRATQWTGVIKNKEMDKCKRLAWFSFADLPENIIDYIYKILINKKQNYSEVGFNNSLCV